jgi:hypothetical protein
VQSNPPPPGPDALGGQPVDGQPLAGSPVAGQPPQRNRRRQRIVLVVFLVLVVGFFGFIWFATRSNATNAKVGDCVSQTGENSLKIVKCDDASATYKVVGRVDDKTEVEASLDACEAFVSQGATQAYWQGKSGSKGLVLCLAKNH